MKHKVKVMVLDAESCQLSSMIDAMVIRPERKCDFDEIRLVVKTAFSGAVHTDGEEHNLVDRLRLTDEYIADLSLIAEIRGRIVGYAMFSLIYIENTKAIALAPLAVLPEFQNLGIGRALIAAGHRKATEGDYCCSVVLGSPEYYSKSGYLPASQFVITAPFDLPSDYYLVFPFKSELPQGTVSYSSAFAV